MRAFNFWPACSLIFLVFRLFLATSTFISEEGINEDSLIFSTSIDDGSPAFETLNFDSTLLSQSDACTNDDATKSHRKRQSKPTWCPQEKIRVQQESAPPTGQQQDRDRSGWADNKPYEGELPSQLRFLDEDPHLLADPKPNKEVCGNRGIFAVCASDRNVGWWGQPDSMQFKLDPCTPCTFFTLIHHSIGPRVGTILIQKHR